MQTATPDGKYLSIGDPYLSSMQLFHALQGTYEIQRTSTLPPPINGHAAQPSQPDSRHSLGTCAIVMRRCRNEDFGVELLQTSVINQTVSSKEHMKDISKRVFRVKNGEWSVWTVEEGRDGILGVVGAKIADLVLGDVMLPQGLYQKVDLKEDLADAMGNVADGGFELVAWLAPKPVLQMKWRDGDGRDVIDNCWPAGDAKLGRAR